jgi:methyl-accepting chemotaxis protein
MAWWKNLTVTWKISLPILFIACLQIGAGIENFSARIKVGDQSAVIYEKYFSGINLALNADRDLYQAALAERTIALNGYNNALFKTYEENVARLEDRLNKALALELDEEINNDIREFLAATAQWKSSANQLIRAVQQGMISSVAAGQQSQTQVAAQFDGARDILDRIGERIKNSSDVRREAITEAESFAASTSLLITTIVILMTGLTLWLLPKSIATGLEDLHKAIASISNGRGNLTERVRLERNDEFGKIGGTFNQFLGTLQDMIRSILASAQNIIQCADRVDDAAISSDRNSRELSDAIKMISSSISQMTTAIDEVSSNTEQVSSETSNANQEAQSVSQTFEKAISVISSLCDDVDRSVHAIQSLKEQAVSIASVVDVIQGIAEQTNLLALNAAIEAARAGEQGRGFAVVADEVRSLASKTQESTEDINKIIVSLQNGVSEVVHAMDVVKTNATTTVSTASHAKESLTGVVSSLSNINCRSIQVASAIEEQSATVGDIARNLDVVMQLSDTLVTHAAAVATSGVHLKTESNDLEALLRNFTV